MISNICIYAEKVYVDYLGANLLDLERVVCNCPDVAPREVNRERCNYCDYTEFKTERKVGPNNGRSFFAGCAEQDIIMQELLIRSRKKKQHGPLSFKPKANGS